MEERQHLLDALNCIPPSQLSYQDWCSVGMALNQEGFSCNVWDNWSRADSRYRPGECAKKWEGFGRSGGTPVTGGTLVNLAKQYGYAPGGGPGTAIGWDDELEAVPDALRIVDQNRPAPTALPPEQPEWDPAKQLIDYLDTLFDSDDLVGIVTDVWKHEGRFSPKKGSWSRTAGQLIEELSRCGGDIGKVIGDPDPAAGAWIRFNPLDGQGVRNDNVTRFDFALVESDEMPLEEQYALYQALELPIACLVSSGGKSLHAIVRVDAPNCGEYQRRVDYLYAICEKNGLKIDRQNRNPSRLSRMPGVMRNGRRQALLGTNLGKESWDEWKEWVEAVNDDLPDLESDLGDDLPELAPPLIDGVLRQGHKLLLAGPSKAGKSFALIELAVCIAEGLPWMGFQCAQGKVLYVNLELDRASCLHRFRDVRRAMGAPERNGVSIWNLRGHSVPMDKLAPKLIRRAAKQNYIAIIIDPIYKVITGDENSADQMAAFCNQFDKVCTALGCAVIYCHHHSKGAQGGKRSMDPASGPGVFARDPDALLDMIELELTAPIREQRQNNAACRIAQTALQQAGVLDRVGPDDLCSRKLSLDACMDLLSTQRYNEVLEAVSRSDAAEQNVTAWRIEGTLREFPSFPALNVWFEYPVHHSDASGVLADIQPEAAAPSWKRNFSKSGKRSKSKEERARDRAAVLEEAFSMVAENGKTTLAGLAGAMGVSEKTVKRHIAENGDFWMDGEEVGHK